MIFHGADGNNMIVEKLKVKGQANRRDILLGTCCRSPKQSKGMDEGLLKQINQSFKKNHEVAVMGEFSNLLEN